MENTFAGFDQDAFDFFAELARNNNKAWFDSNRGRYDQHLVGTFRGLLVELEPFLLKLNPNFETAGKTNRNLSRINRDIRFSKDKSPYKSNYYLYVFDSRGDRAQTGRLYVGLCAECVTVGFSIYAGERGDEKNALRDVFRKRLKTHRNAFEKMLERIVRGRRYETYWHRQEKGEWAQHAGLPRRDEDWETLQAWVVRKVFLPGARGLNTPGFAAQVRKCFAELYPLYVYTSVSGPRWQNELRRIPKATS